MPSPRVLARILLVLLMLADGVLGARAATLMATQHVGHGVPAGAEGSDGHAAQGPECAEAPQVRAALPGEPADTPPGECTCLDGKGCSCNCLLPFHRDGIALWLWPQRVSGTYLVNATLAPPRQPLSRVFRPPIG